MNAAAPAAGQDLLLVALEEVQHHAVGDAESRLQGLGRLLDQALESLLRPGHFALAGTARAEEEEATLGWLEESPNHSHFASHYRSIESRMQQNGRALADPAGELAL